MPARIDQATRVAARLDVLALRRAAGERVDIDTIRMLFGVSQPTAYRLLERHRARASRDARLRLARSSGGAAEMASELRGSPCAA